jgi:hypothetical protein
MIILKDFNVDILKNNNHAKKKQKLLDFMDKFKFNSQFCGNTTKVGFQLDHIWTNIPKNECKSSVIKAYWLGFHKPIYIAFNLPNTLPMYNKKPLSFPFLKNIIYVTPCVIHDAFPI